MRDIHGSVPSGFPEIPPIFTGSRVGYDSYTLRNGSATCGETYFMFPEIGKRKVESAYDTSGLGDSSQIERCVET